MLRVNAAVDYGLRAAILLARNPTVPLKASEIAAAEGLPARFLSATLSSLRYAGLLNSRRGGEGGFWLARAAEDITVADLVRAIDGNVVDISVVGQGSTAAWWQTVASSFERSLDHVTLAELIDDAGPVDHLAGVVPD